MTDALEKLKVPYFTGYEVMAAIEYVILVDQENNIVGKEEKINAHANNLLHRAFSVFIFRTQPQLELLLQQRAWDKYHSPGLWTNTCCSHPRKDETIIAAGERRLREEVGISANLKDLGWFHYNAHFDNGFSENEIDHVLIGYVAPDTTIEVNPAEVNAHRWITIANLEQELAARPDMFTAWLKPALNLLKKHFI